VLVWCWICRGRNRDRDGGVVKRASYASAIRPSEEDEGEGGDAEDSGDGGSGDGEFGGRDGEVAR